MRLGAFALLLVAAAIFLAPVLGFGDTLYLQAVTIPGVLGTGLLIAAEFVDD